MRYPSLPVSTGGFTNQPRANWRYFLVAVALTAIIGAGFWWESALGFGTPPPRIVYVESWPASRSPADIARVQRVEESSRQVAIAVFEIERGEALLRRADTPAKVAAARAHIAANRAANTRWSAAAAAARADLAANPPARMFVARPGTTGADALVNLVPALDPK